MADKPRRTALVLGGGGTLGALQVGFIRRILELEIPIDLVVGTSVGALNAAHFAMVHDPLLSDLEASWRQVEGKRLFHRSIPRIVLNLIRSRRSLYSDRLVRGMVTRYLPGDDFDTAVVPLYITAANLRTGERDIFHKGSVLQAILASTAIPGLFPPVRIGEHLYVDGGVADTIDVSAAIELGATDIIAIDLNAGLAPIEPGHIVEVMLRSIYVLAGRNAACHMEHAMESARIAHILPGMNTGSIGTFEHIDLLLEQSYPMARGVFEQCWDGEAVVPGTYRLTVPTGV